MEGIRKVAYIIIITIALTLFSYNPVMASQRWIKTDEYEPSSQTEVSGASKLNSMGQVMVGTIRPIGTSISVIVIVILGIKYMMGSVEEKAQYKKTLLPYVIGAVMVFAITNLISIVIQATDII